ADSFFFTAEDGIPARNVTGVQTCALPISDAPYAITAVGSTDAIDGRVQVTITKPADARVTCQVIGVTGGTPSAEVASTNRVFEGQYTVTGGDTWGWGFAPVPDGVYRSDARR